MKSRTKTSSSRRAHPKRSHRSEKRMDILPGPIIPDGSYSFGFYDAVAFSYDRAARPYFATDSRATLNAWSRLRAMSLARWAYINVPVIKGAVDLMARLTVGTGFTPHTVSKIDKELAKAADDYVTEKMADIGFMHGESMDELLLHDSRGVDVDGDLGYLMTSDEQGEPKIQLIEGHRIKTGDVTDPQCRDGIWVDGYGRRDAFNVLLPEEDKSKRIEAKDFIYLAERNRPDELRSMTNLIHALNPVQDLYEILGYATQSAKKNAEFATVIETPTPSDLPIGPTMDQLMRASQPAANGQPAVPRQMVTREQIYGSGGKIPILKPGEKFATYSHNHPAPTIEQWSVFLIRGVAVGFGVPFEILWNPEAIGGANTRLITALTRARLQQRRAALIYPKLNRVRFWIIARGIKKGDLKWNPDLLRCIWNPNFIDITVDAGRESKERRQNVLNGLDSWTGYYRDNGEEYAEQAQVRKRDIILQCEIAAEIVKLHPQLSFTEALDRVALLGVANLREVDTQAEPVGNAPNQPINKK